VLDVSLVICWLLWFVSESERFDFQNHLEHQGPKQFIMLRYSCFDDMINVFYANHRITNDGILWPEVNCKRIIIQPSDWMSLAKLNYQGLQLNVATYPKHLNYYCDTTFAVMLRLGIKTHNVINVGVLSMNDKLLHYMFVHILISRLNNYS